MKDYLFTRLLSVKVCLTTLTFLLFHSFSYSQSATIPMGSPSYHMLDRLEIKCGKLMEGYHSVNKPIDRRGAMEFVSYIDTVSTCELSDVDLANIDYLYRDNMEFSEEKMRVSEKPILKVFYKQPANFLSVVKPNFKAVINPVAQVSVGYDTDSKSGNKVKQLNTKGFEVRGQITDKLSFYTFFTSEQAFYQGFITDKINETKGIPGAGYYKSFKKGGYDYFRAKGYVTFSPSKYVSIQFGHDKNFIGDGYRSLFLSDYGNDYFFLKLNTRVWKLNYTNIFAELTANYDGGADKLLNKKYMAAHHLSFNVSKWLNLGVFEAVVFSRENHFELQYLNPIIFYRSLEQTLGSPDNAMIGFDFKANFAKHFSLYGQLLLDEMNIGKEFDFANQKLKGLFKPKRWWGTKVGTQLGLKYIDVFGVDNLDFQIEVNLVRPYTYTHDDKVTTWTNYNLPLAHPLGANFTEIVSILRYQPAAKWFITLKHIRARYGEDTDSTNWGGDVFNSYRDIEREYGNFVGQGVRTKLNLTDVIVTFMPWHNIAFDFNYRYRKAKSEIEERSRSSHFANLSVRWNILYRNIDF
ncbi:MAG: hypothetical protein M9887_04490 [Chitinophagales bacterium]|nr:hypothetical protein [Chitinophagales bacterium]